MTREERAVIKAARAYVKSDPYNLFGSGERVVVDLHDAVTALDTAEADPARVTEVPWSQVTEGDLIKSVKNGKFYEVVSSVRLSGGWTIKLKGIDQPIKRPRPGEPTAFVKRGATGKAMDVFIDVFSSGNGYRVK